MANVLALVLPWVIKIIIDDVLVNKDASFLHVIILSLLGVLAFHSLFNFLRMYRSHLLGEILVKDLRKKIVSHMQRVSLMSVNRISPAQILSRITQDVDSVRRFLFGDFVEFIYSIFSSVFILFILGWVNLKLTIISLLTLPLFAMVYFRLIPYYKNKHSRLREMYGLLGSRLNEVLHGLKVIRSFAKDKHEQELFDQKQNKIINIAKETHYLNAWLWVGIEFFTSLGVVCILWVGGLDVIAGRMSVGELVSFYTYLGMLFSPIIRMVVINTAYQESMAALSRVNDVMAINDEVAHVHHPIALSSIHGFIEFDRVGFEYTADEFALKDVSFKIEPGEKIGVVGASGSGKTTLISLLLRLFDPTRGDIRVDGVDLKKLNLETYRENIAVVLQDDFLFKGTIEENIKYGYEAASEKEVVHAATIAQAHSFIHTLKHGYQTQIGERGVNLSNGQRQRIAIARALLRNPSILILDEATSSVDALTENDVQNAIYEFMSNKTMIMIAHRFSTIVDCDKIIVMDKGKIVEMGDHNNLLKKGSLYSNLYYEQFKDSDKNILSKF